MAARNAVSQTEALACFKAPCNRGARRMQGSSGSLGKGPHAAHPARCTLWIRGHEIARTSGLRLSQGTPADSGRLRASTEPSPCALSRTAHPQAVKQVHAWRVLGQAFCQQDDRSTVGDTPGSLQERHAATLGWQFPIANLRGTLPATRIRSPARSTQAFKKAPLLSWRTFCSGSELPTPALR